MLNKSLLMILTTISFVLLPSAVFAIVTCSPCVVDGCVCQVTDCSKGIFNVFTISDCSGVPYVRDTFNNGVRTWYPQNAIDYYILVLCDDGTTRSACTPQAALIKGQPTITTPITTTTTTPRTTITTFSETETTTEETEATYATEEQPSGGGFNFLWILVIFIIIGVGFYFLKIRKKKKLSYEEVYKKWSR